MGVTNVTCLTCNNSGPRDDVSSWHRFRHPLNTDGNAPNVFAKPIPENAGNIRDQLAEQAGVSVQTVSFPFDPVLRQALIDKGVLTPDDLTQAELKIRAISGTVISHLT